MAAMRQRLQQRKAIRWRILSAQPQRRPEAMAEMVEREATEMEAAAQVMGVTAGLEETRSRKRRQTAAAKGSTWLSLSHRRLAAAVETVAPPGMVATVVP